MTDTLDDYEEQIDILRQRVKKFLKDFDKVTQADKPSILKSVQNSLGQMEDNAKFYKQTLIMLPKKDEAEYKRKHEEFVAEINELKEEVQNR